MFKLDNLKPPITAVSGEATMLMGDYASGPHMHTIPTDKDHAGGLQPHEGTLGAIPMHTTSTDTK